MPQSVTLTRRTDVEPLPGGAARRLHAASQEGQVKYWEHIACTATTCAYEPVKQSSNFIKYCMYAAFHLSLMESGLICKERNSRERKLSNNLLTTGEPIMTFDASEENSKKKKKAQSDSSVKRTNGSQMNHNISSAAPKKFMSSVCPALSRAARASWPKSSLTLSYDVEQDSHETHKMSKARLECQCFTAAETF